jgi:hypothetical protein
MILVRAAFENLRREEDPNFFLYIEAKATRALKDY